MKMTGLSHARAGHDAAAAVRSTPIRRPFFISCTLPSTWLPLSPILTASPCPPLVSGSVSHVPRCFTPISFLLLSATVLFCLLIFAHRHRTALHCTHSPARFRLSRHAAAAAQSTTTPSFFLLQPPPPTLSLNLPICVLGFDDPSARVHVSVVPCGIFSLPSFPTLPISCTLSLSIRVISSFFLHFLSVSLVLPYIRKIHISIHFLVVRLTSRLAQLFMVGRRVVR